MMGSFRIFYENKCNFEAYLLSDIKFRDIKGMTDIHSKETSYPVNGQYKNLTFELDFYRGYIFGSLPSFYVESKDIKYIRNLNFQQLSEAINMLGKATVEIEKTKISKLTIGLNIHAFSNASLIIKNNILMFNLKGFNQDKIGTPEKVLKQFDYEDFTLGIYSFKKEENILRIELRFKKSGKLRSIGIRNIMDLKNKEKLRELISMFFKRFDELTIVDSFSYDDFSIKDKEKMKLYMNDEEWGKFPKTSKGRMQIPVILTTQFQFKLTT